MRNPRTLVLITVALWSWGGVLARMIALRSQFLFIGISFTFSFLTLAAYFLYDKTALGTFSGLRNLRYYAFGLFGYFVYKVALIRCYRLFNSASEPLLLNYTWPLFTVLFTWAFAARRRRRRGVVLVELLGLACGALAVAQIATGGRLGSLRLANPPAVAWGLVAGASYGLFSAFSSTVGADDHAGFLLCSIAASWVAMLFFVPAEFGLLRTLTLRDLVLVLVVGCLLEGLGYITWTRANRRARELGISIASVASLTLALPVLNLAWVALLLREGTVLRPYFALSLGLIVAGSMLCQRAAAIADFLARRAPRSTMAD